MHTKKYASFYYKSKYNTKQGEKTINRLIIYANNQFDLLVCNKLYIDYRI